MKIRNVHDSIPSVTDAVDTHRDSMKAPEAPLASSEVVNSSNSAHGAAAASIGTQPADAAFDEGRVAEVCQRLDYGQYAIDAGRIADAMISRMVFLAKSTLH